MIINDDCELVCINESIAGASELTSLVIVNEKGMNIKFMPDGNGNMSMTVEDKNYKGRKTLRKCELDHLINYLVDWLENDKWREE